MTAPFNAARRICERILELLGVTVQYSPVFDTGDIRVVRSQLVALQGHMAGLRSPEVNGNATQNRRPFLVQLGARASIHPGAFGQKSAGRVHSLLADLLSIHDSQPSSPDIFTLLRTTFDLDEDEALRAPVHGTAIQIVWKGDVRDTDGSTVHLPLNVVLIDDDRQFHKEVKTRFPRRTKSDFRLFCFESLAKYDDAVMKRRAPPYDDVDLFLIDIVDERSPGGPRPVGIERDLQRIVSQRGLSNFPQVFMISALPSVSVAHIAASLGASYYFEKARFLAHPDPARLLGHVLWHVTKGLSQVPLLRGGVAPNGEGWPSDLQILLPTAWNLLSESLDLISLNFLQKLQGGLTDAHTILVEPIARDGEPFGGSVATATSPRRLLPRVFKSSDAQGLAMEWHAFHTYVSPLLTRGFARVDTGFHQAGSRAAICYTLAGSDAAFAAAQLVPCLDLFGSREALAGTVPRLLFESVLAPLHQSSTRRATFAELLDAIALELRPLPLGKFDPAPPSWGGNSTSNLLTTRVSEANADSLTQVYLHRDEVGLRFPSYVWKPEKPLGQKVRPGTRFAGPRDLPNALFVDPRLAMQEMLQKAERTTPKQAFIRPRLEALIDGAQHQGDEPIPSLAESVETLQMFLPLLRSRTAREIDWGIVHGDLNLQNVLAALDAGDLWLIDFARTRPGPPALDFALFELEIRLQILAPTLGKLLPQSLKAEEWYARGRAVTLNFEIATQMNCRVALAVLKSAMEATLPELDQEKFKRDFDRLSPDLTAGWQQVHAVRNSAFATYYRSQEGRATYAFVFAILCLRAMQKYEKEVFREDCGPIGLQWAADGFRVAVESFRQIGAFDCAS